MFPSPWLWRSHDFLFGQEGCQGPVVWSARLTQRPGVHPALGPESLHFSIQKTFHAVLPRLALIPFQIIALWFHLYHLKEPLLDSSIPLTFLLGSAPLFFFVTRTNLFTLLLVFFLFQHLCSLCLWCAGNSSWYWAICSGIVLPIASLSFCRGAFRCTPCPQHTEMKFGGKCDQDVPAAEQGWSHMATLFRIFWQKIESEGCYPILTGLWSSCLCFLSWFLILKFL